jgi:hypothetical protein
MKQLKKFIPADKLEPLVANYRKLIAAAVDNPMSRCDVAAFPPYTLLHYCSVALVPSAACAARLAGLAFTGSAWPF